eukprot:gnl/Chilomastix_cuspidata/2180.p1 GENE.gnl/Chilomastix_cuspidata/2180~~gnl/Chilomastix_cuspidata/2180.p1  ORF type:complete len:771 (-),score=295.64 gnl/Chilomastix_cuspidata/2180:894-3206(-)
MEEMQHAAPDAAAQVEAHIAELKESVETLCSASRHEVETDEEFIKLQSIIACLKVHEVKAKRQIHQLQTQISELQDETLRLDQSSEILQFRAEVITCTSQLYTESALNEYKSSDLNDALAELAAGSESDDISPPPPSESDKTEDVAPPDAKRVPTPDDFRRSEKRRIVALFEQSDKKKRELEICEAQIREQALELAAAKKERKSDLQNSLISGAYALKKAILGVQRQHEKEKERLAASPPGSPHEPNEKEFSPLLARLEGAFRTLTETEVAARSEFVLPTFGLFRWHTQWEVPVPAKLIEFFASAVAAPARFRRDQKSTRWILIGKAPPPAMKNSFLEFRESGGVLAVRASSACAAFPALVAIVFSPDKWEKERILVPLAGAARPKGLTEMALPAHWVNQVVPALDAAGASSAPFLRDLYRELPNALALAAMLTAPFAQLKRTLNERENRSAFHFPGMSGDVPCEVSFVKILSSVERAEARPAARSAAASRGASTINSPAATPVEEPAGYSDDPPSQRAGIVQTPIALVHALLRFRLVGLPLLIDATYSPFILELYPCFNVVNVTPVKKNMRGKVSPVLEQSYNIAQDIAAAWRDHATSEFGKNLRNAFVSAATTASLPSSVQSILEHSQKPARRGFHAPGEVPLREALPSTEDEWMSDFTFAGVPVIRQVHLFAAALSAVIRFAEKEIAVQKGLKNPTPHFSDATDAFRLRSRVSFHQFPILFWHERNQAFHIAQVSRMNRRPRPPPPHGDRPAFRARRNDMPRHFGNQ